MRTNTCQRLWGCGKTTEEELRAIRLCRQHISNPADKLTVVKDLNGLQAQFISNAFHALRIRTRGGLDHTAWGDGLVKAWTVRGTMHVFAQTDLPLFLHEGRSHFLRPQDAMGDDPAMTAERKQYFACKVIRWIAEGTGEREVLKRLCAENGMTAAEAGSFFDSWGGAIRSLAEQGVIAYKAQEKKEFRLCPPFTPMAEEPARLEILSRYLRHYGPATVRDMAYYLGKSMTQVRTWLRLVPVSAVNVNGEDHYYAGALSGSVPDIPNCVFLAGFDPLLMGYEKHHSPFLPPDYLRSVFHLAGIVMPAILLSGRVAGTWKKTAGKITFRLFDERSGDRRKIMRAAERLWGGSARIKWAAD